MGITVDPNTREVVLVMEYLKHGALDDYVRKKGPLSPKQQAQIALDVAKGLLYIHSRTPKVIHRDIKPGNILVSASRTIECTSKFRNFDCGRLTRSFFSCTKMEKERKLQILEPPENWNPVPIPSLELIFTPRPKYY